MITPRKWLPTPVLSILLLLVWLLLVRTAFGQLVLGCAGYSDPFNPPWGCSATHKPMMLLRFGCGYWAISSPPTLRSRDR